MKKNGIKDALSKEIPFFMIAPALIWQILFFCAPFAIIVGLSFIKSPDDLLTPHLTLSYYSSLFDFSHLKIITRSLFFAIANTFFCLIIAYPVAYYLARKIKRFKNVFLFFLILPFWINMLVQIYAWFFILERNGLINTFLLKMGVISTPLHLANNLGTVLLVMIYCYMPFMIMPLYTALEKINERLIESSYDLGANGWQTFLNITLPLSLPGIKTGCFLVFVPSFGEFVIPALMGGAKNMFVGSLISHYFLVAHDASQGAAFTCFSGAILLSVLGLSSWYFSKKISVVRG